MDIKSEIKRLAMDIQSAKFRAALKPIQSLFTDTSDVRKISDIRPTESLGREISPEKYERGKKGMLLGNKRKPITVRDKNGKLEIVDGNTTYYLLKEMGYDRIPIKIENTEKTLEEIRKDAIAKGVSKEELQQVLPGGSKAGNSKKWLINRLKNKTAMEFDTKEAMDKYLDEHPDADKSLHHVKPQEYKKPAESESVDYSKRGIMGDIDSLPSNSKQQNIKSADEFYSQAQESYKDMTRMLDMGHGLDVKIGATVITPESKGDFKSALNDDRPVIVIGSIKGKERAEEKVNSDYGGDWSKLKDGVRSTISVKKISDLATVFEKLGETGMKLAQKPKDRYQKPTVSGYRDILLNVVYPNGHIGEIQINCHEMLKAKMLGHKIYEEVRTVESNAKRDGRDTMTDDELQIVASANKRMKEIYEDAYRKISGE